MSKWLSVHRRCSRFDLDACCPEVDEVDFHSFAGTRGYFQSLLREIAARSCTALHLFFHEANDCVQVCLWHHSEAGGTWEQEIPLNGADGLRLLSELRRGGRASPGRPGYRRGRIHYKWNGHWQSLRLESPHEHDVRLYSGESRPSSLPFVLVFAGNWSGPSSDDTVHP